MAVDAHVYFAFVRHFRPARIVEVGAGYSTLVAVAAATRNAEDGHRPEIVAVDPYPPDFLADALDGTGRVVADRVQNVDLSLFTSLAPNDILFIDSTHVLRSGGDVQTEYCEILPRLGHGVLVQVHDVSLPKPYPRTYFDQRLYWNEQYLLQAFLAFNFRFEVIWPGNYIAVSHPAEVRELIPEYDAMRAKYPESEPSSFWMRVR